MAYCEKQNTSSFSPRPRLGIANRSNARLESSAENSLYSPPNRLRIEYAVWDYPSAIIACALITTYPNVWHDSVRVMNTLTPHTDV